MSREKNPTRVNADRKIKRACAGLGEWCMPLESRQLLSAVVSVYPIPNAQTADWYNSTSHIVAGPNGNFWFTDSVDNAIGEVTPQGQVTMFPLPALDAASANAGDSQTPGDIIVGPDHNLWFTETGVDVVGRITTAGVITEFHTPTADSEPQGLAVGSDGNIWFLESNANQVADITTGGKVTEYSLGSLSLSGEDAMAEGSDGKIWFAADDANDNNILASITTKGKIDTYPIADNPTAIALGADGNLWVGADDGNIDQVTPAGVVTSFAVPDGADINTIVAGNDGTLWFTADENNQFGSISTAGIISQYTIPGSDVNSGTGISPADMIQASDGTLWFTDANNPQVGNINLAGALIGTSLGDLTVTAGSTSSATFASFTDFAGGTDPSAYSATITLANNTSVAATITANGSGGFNVSGSSDWALGQDGDTTVTITDNANPTRVATASVYLSVNAPIATGTGINVSATSGQTYSGMVAQFSGVAVNSLSSYSATIDWGDGHDSTGTITLNANGGFDVAGANTYAQAGSYTVTTTLSPYGAFRGFFPSPIAPIGTPTPGQPVLVGTVHTVPLVGVVKGSAIDTTLNSGAAVGGASSLPVEPVSPPISIFGSSGGTATSTATVAAGVMDGTGYTIKASSTGPYSGDVASFVLADPTADTSHFHATVTWSDPGVQDWTTNTTAPSAGVITSDGQGNLTVSTSANLTQQGLFHFVVSITDDRLGSGAGAAVGVAFGQVIVGTPYPYFITEYAAGGAALTAGAIKAPTASTADTDPVLSEKVRAIVSRVKGNAGKTFTGAVGTLFGIYSSSKSRADLQGTINWGDGTTSSAAFTGGGKGGVTVRGSHKYATPGDYSLTVTATQSLSSGGKLLEQTPLLLPAISSTVKVAGAPASKNLPVGNAGDYAATVGVSFNSLSATAALPAFSAGQAPTASIRWGDGSSAVGALTSLGDGQYAISGPSHTYHKRGSYTLWVIIDDTVGKKTTRIARLKGIVKVS